MNWFERGWYKQHKGTYLLMPLALLFSCLSAIRRWLFRFNLKKKYRSNKPVIVVGNITVGGTGKTPFVIWLVEFLRAQGLNPGVISRGYGGQITQGVHLIQPDDHAELVGDETRLIANRTQAPVVVGSNRAECCQKLEQLDVDLIISDDGLQHYALARDLEIILLDGSRLLGNGWLLPVGPLRELSWRVRDAEFVITNGQVDSSFTKHYFNVVPQPLTPVSTNSQTPGVFNREQPSHAVCAIGNPQRFYRSLAEQNIQILEYHHFIDHHKFKASDFARFNNEQVVMTEKDAVKCNTFANDSWWYLPIGVEPDGNFIQKLTDKIQLIRKNYGI
ncbi:tetraacyldisaccharide 4'-kinase [Catenovulum agarivorans DS-2]|uniref:Tetraacyldisaccharide 4'-kinase n=1 Tax=Catenovulum agarivorans DS-2 TaxID=1328313 RepID=W7R3Q9_9ALTE|nr:tetraacyldisaccharide 4'-kinase [Catenovulum agarivorans]EWH12265.1 tetraacyldisaccharide 4'-kinase [Catenovulum agarivorans DS-2]